MGKYGANESTNELYKSLHTTRTSNFEKLEHQCQ